jgi:iron complex transport system substrate-binding protein
LKNIVVIFLFLIAFCAGAGEKKLRVVSLAPSLTETIFQLGRGDWLVGRTTACKYPEAVKKIPVIGGFGSPSFEKIVASRPDVVVACFLQNPILIKKFKAMNIKLYILKTRKIEDYLMNVITLGNILDCKSAAKAEIKRVQNGLRGFEDKYKHIPTEKRAKVLLMIWDAPLMTCGNKSFLNDCISYAGGYNVAAEQNKDYFKSSLEWMIKQTPDVVMFPAMKENKFQEMKKHEGWSSLPAVKNNRFYYDIDEDLFFTPGPRILKSIAIMEKCIQEKQP